MELNIEKHIEEQLQNIDIEGIVTAQVRAMIAKTLQQEIKDLTKRKIANIIDEEIQIALSNEILTDDGWGKHERYDNFEIMFKQTFKAKLNNSYEMKRTIERAVKEKVEDFYKKETKVFAEGFANYLDDMRRKMNESQKHV